jgi:copper(I)-binding protein
VNRFGLRARAVNSGLAACGLAAAVLLSGCGAGQISQTATQEPAINGVSGTAGEIALRNIHLRAPQTSDYVRPGTDVELIFVAANNSPDEEDRLVSVRSDVATVSVAGDARVPAGGALVVGEGAGQIAPLEAVEAADAVTARVALTKPISNGLTYDFEFTFERGGKTTVAVPISAEGQQRRDDSGELDNLEDTGGHH